MSEDTKTNDKKAGGCSHFMPRLVRGVKASDMALNSEQREHLRSIFDWEERSAKANITIGRPSNLDEYGRRE